MFLLRGGEADRGDEPPVGVKQVGGEAGGLLDEDGNKSGQGEAAESDLGGGLLFRPFLPSILKSNGNEEDPADLSGENPLKRNKS